MYKHMYVHSTYSTVVTPPANLPGAWNVYNPLTSQYIYFYTYTPCVYMYTACVCVAYI